MCQQHKLQLQRPLTQLHPSQRSPRYRSRRGHGSHGTRSCDGHCTDEGGGRSSSSTSSSGGSTDIERASTCDHGLTRFTRHHTTLSVPTNTSYGSPLPYHIAHHCPQQPAAVVSCMLMNSCKPSVATHWLTYAKYRWSTLACRCQFKMVATQMLQLPTQQLTCPHL